MNYKDVDLIIKQVNGSMAIEGMPLTKTDKDRIRRSAGNDVKVEKEIAELINKYRSAEYGYGE
jgi:hypothetical protein